MTHCLGRDTPYVMAVLAAIGQQRAPCERSRARRAETFMQLRFAVADPLPLFRRGVSSLLTDMGLSPDAPNDVSAWLADEERKVLLLTLAGPEHWALHSTAE